MPSGAAKPQDYISKYNISKSCLHVMKTVHIFSVLLGTDCRNISVCLSSFKYMPARVSLSIKCLGLYSWKDLPTMDAFAQKTKQHLPRPKQHQYHMRTRAHNFS